MYIYIHSRAGVCMYMRTRTGPSRMVPTPRHPRRLSSFLLNSRNVSISLIEGLRSSKRVNSIYSHVGRGAKGSVRREAGMRGGRFQGVPQSPRGCVQSPPPRPSAMVEPEPRPLARSYTNYIGERPISA